MVFTAQPTLAGAQDFYRDIKRRVADKGRHPESLKIMPGLFAVVGASQAEADDKFGMLQSLIEPKAGLALLGRMIGNFDLSGYPLDGPLPELPQTEDGQRSRQQLLTNLAQGENLSIRQLYARIAGGRGHFTVTGTAQTVADQMQAWFEGGAADGFNFFEALPNTSLKAFVELAVPVLQARGLLRTDYEGETLRSHFQLPVPANRHTVAAAGSAFVREEAVAA